VAAVLVVLTACGSGSSSTAGGTSSGTLVIGYSRQMTNLDPGYAGSVDGDGSVQRAVYSSLTYYDANQQLQGDLATDWKQDDTSTWTFHVRTGVKFSDGTPLTTDDIKWNFDRFLDPSSKATNAASVRAFVKSVDAPDDHTVVIHTNGPYLDLPDRLATFFILDKDFVEAHDGQADAALGTGPYEIKTIDLENGATLVPNPNYYGAKPVWKTVKYVALTTETARVQAAQAGQVDIAIQYEPSDLKLFANSSTYDTGDQFSGWNNTIRFNENIKPLNNKLVRQALNYAIDKESIIKNVLGVDEEPLAGQVVSKPWDTLVNSDIQAYPYDPAKAKQLLAQAGYPNGFSIELALTQGSYVAQDAAAQVIQKELGDIGVTVKITQAAFADWVARTYSDQAPAMYYIGYNSGYKSPAARLQIYGDTNPQSHYSPQDTHYDDLVTKLIAAPDKAAQQKDFDEATAWFRDQAHLIFLWPQPLTYVINKNLDWTPRPEHYLDPQDITPKA